MLVSRKIVVALITVRLTNKEKIMKLLWIITKKSVTEAIILYFQPLMWLYRNLRRKKLL